MGSAGGGLVRGDRGWAVRRSAALSLVEHFVRDRLHHALWPTNPREFKAADEAPAPEVLLAVDGALARAEALLPAARAARADALVGYAERLASCRKERAVDREEAVGRVFDARRCHPKPDLPVSIRRAGAVWVAGLDLAGSTPGEMRIDAVTGRMWAALTK